jgi:hypothetical protein
MHVPIAEAAPVHGARSAQTKAVGGKGERDAESLAGANGGLHCLAVAGRVAGDVNLGNGLLLQGVLELVPTTEDGGGEAALFAVVFPAEVSENVAALVGVATRGKRPPRRARTTASAK